MNHYYSIIPHFSLCKYVCVFLLSIHNAVVSVFQRKDLGENELYTLNEGVRSVCRCMFSFVHSRVLLTLTHELLCVLGRD